MFVRYLNMDAKKVDFTNFVLFDRFDYTVFTLFR
jgi:hypothetical protein